MNKKLKLIWLKNQQASALLVTLFILTSILTVSLGASTLLVTGTIINRQQQRSVIAYFAAEAGMERTLWEVRENGYVLPPDSLDDIFVVADLGNGAGYNVDYASTTLSIIFTSTGKYLGIKRAIRSSYTR